MPPNLVSGKFFFVCEKVFVHACLEKIFIGNYVGAALSCFAKGVRSISKISKEKCVNGQGNSLKDRALWLSIASRR